LVISTALSSLRADEPLNQFSFSQRVDTSQLARIENRVLPACLVDGPNRYADLPQYYAAENPELVEYFATAQNRYESKDDRSYRSMALVAGDAGVGKTFIKGRVFKKSYAKGEVVKLDIKDVYRQWRKDGLTGERADLHCGDVVLNRLLTLTDKQSNPRLLIDLLKSQTASFYVIDSLDEVHPDDYQWILNQVEQFVYQDQQRFLQVVVFGRGFAFHDYWQMQDDLKHEIKLFVLKVPHFKTTGDLLVSDWSNDWYRYHLCWAPAGRKPDEMLFPDYQRWASMGYSRSGEFRTAAFQPNQSLTKKSRQLLHDWCQKYATVSPMIYNLAGNGILRDIVENYAVNDLPFDEQHVMTAYLEAWLNRDGESSDRPCNANPQHLDLYLRLLEDVATKYLVEGKVDELGFFAVCASVVIKLICHCKSLEFSVTQILNRSGLKSFNPRNENSMKYRFEPIWMHRLLVERRNVRSLRSFRRTASRDDTAQRYLP